MKKVSNIEGYSDELFVKFISDPVIANKIIYYTCLNDEDWYKMEDEEVYLVDEFYDLFEDYIKSHTDVTHKFFEIDVKSTIDLDLCDGSSYDTYQSKIAEYAGRLCYNSIDKITKNSYEKFLEKIKKNKHLSVLEHKTVIILFNETKIGTRPFFDLYYNLEKTHELLGLLCPFRITEVLNGCFYMVTNYRYALSIPHITSIGSSATDPSLVADNVPLDIYKLHEEHLRAVSKHLRESVLITAPISITRELNRHRCLSISEQSTRYCNLKENDKIITPYFSDEENSKNYTNMMTYANQFYETLIVIGAKPQEAREALVLGTKSKAMYTAFRDQWKDVLDKRSGKNAHPLMQKLCKKLNEIVNNESKNNQQVEK